MRGIYFNNTHTADDWGLILNSKAINPPEPKVVAVTVDGRDGDLDLSEALTGEVRYSNRNAEFAFLALEGSQADREELIGTIVNMLHGKKVNISTDDDPDRYLVGRCTVSEVSNNRSYASFKVSANCEPWRYSTTEVNRVIALTSTPVSLVLTNSGYKTVTPTLEVNGSVHIEFGSNSSDLSTGSYKLTGLLLAHGTTTIKVNGSGTLSVRYREAVL